MAAFDILHLGHLHHLRAAKRKGETLVVAVTKDRSVNKGPDRPYMREEAREYIVRNLRMVDRVILVDSSLEALKKVRPQVFVKGGEYRNRILTEDYEWCMANGCKIRFTGPPIDSSTKYHDRLRPR
mgnify:CR=1 FL=1